jgi:hypothetical protein
MASSAYHRIAPESRALLESAVRMLESRLQPLHTDEIVLMVYNLGRMDGRMEQLDRSEAMVREALRG